MSDAATRAALRNLAPRDGSLHVSVAQATLGGLRGTRGGMGRTLLAVLAIALGVALGFAVQLINHTAVAEFTTGLATLAGEADLQVSGGRDGFDESLYPRLARDPAIAVASPVVEIEASVPGRDETLTLVGVDALRAAAVTPALIGASRDTVDLLRPDSVFVSGPVRASLDVRPGDTLVLQGPRGPVALRIAGEVRGDGQRRIAVMDIAGLQDRFARAGRITRIDLRVRPGFDAGQVAARIAALLPPGVGVATPRDNAEITARFTRAYRVNLDVLALVALFTGGLLVFSTQALAVVRRRAAFALLRSLGITRRALLRLLLAEGAALGLVGALVGLAAGAALATLALRTFGPDLGGGFFRGRTPALVIDWAAALVFGLAGVAAAMLGSLAPAREAARAAPAAALKSGDLGVAWHAAERPWLAVAAVVAGAAGTALPPIAGLPLAGYAAIALLLLGTLGLLPLLSQALLRLAPRPRGVPPKLALARLAHAPAQASLGLVALTAAVALMAAMAIMVASFRTSLGQWLVDVLPADLYVRAGSGGDSPLFPAGADVQLAKLPGVARVELSRITSILLDPSAPRVALLARDIDPAHAEARLALRARLDAPLPADVPAAWVSEVVADRTHWKPGERITLPLAGRAIPFVVAGVFRDYARQQGAIVVERRRYAEVTGDASANEAALWLAPGASVASVREGLRAIARGAEVDAATPAELRATSLRIFDRTFAVTYALEAVAVVLGLTGLSSAFGAEVLMRRRELGMLRHLGMTRAEVRAMLAAEGLALCAVAVVIGVALGFVIALILIHVVNPQSFHWTMELDVPWLALGALAAALLVLGMATAALAGHRAMDDDVVRAVREDW